MRTFLALALIAPLFLAPAAAQQPATPDPAPPNQGVGERLGESVDRGLNTLGEKLRRTWADIRKSVDELTVQGRVYGRLRWDKALANAPIEVTVQNESTVTLTGTVADEAAHTTAVTLAQGTIGVGKVVDHLTVSTTKTTTVTTETGTTPPPTVPTVPPLDAPK
jgi:hyperosmotically inducible periplasmic protein